jgi:hypothetical protein
LRRLAHLVLYLKRLLFGSLFDATGTEKNTGDSGNTERCP